MIKFGMMNSINGDRRYKAEDFAQYFATFIGNGIFVKPSDCLQIRANGDSMNVLVRPGKAWVNGYYLINDEDYNLSLAVGDTTLNRIDRIVIRLDFIQRKMSVEVKKGTLSASPVAPTLKRDADAYELALADVYIAKGALTLSQASITDTRLNNNLCGLMHGVVDQVDTTTIFNQYQQWFNDYSVTKASEFLAWQTNVTTALEAWIDAQEKGFEAWRQAEEQLYYAWLQGRKDNFDEWFATIRGILDEEAAGNIMNVINDHKDSPVPHKYYDEGLAQPMLYGLKRNAELDTPAFVYGATEAGPHDVINLPNYEQVEGIKNVVDTTGGVTVDINDVRHKSVVTSPWNFVTGLNDDFWKPLMDDFESKYPGMTSKFVFHRGRKHHIRDSIYMTYSENNRYIVWYDMSTMKVVSCTDFTTNNLFRVFVQDGLWFQDDRYIYVRGKDATAVFKLAVFDKNTFEYVTAIGISGPDYTTAATIHPDTIYRTSEIPFINGYFFLPNPTMALILRYQINYSGAGIPLNFTFPGVSGGTVQYVNIRGIFEYKGFLYALTSSDGTTHYLSKNQILANGTISQISIVLISSGINIGSQSMFTYKYTSENGTDYALMSFGNSQPLISINLNMPSMVNIMSNINNYPTFDYENRNTMWVQSYTIGYSAFEYNGRAYEPIWRLTMDAVTGIWKSETFWTQTSLTPGGGVGASRVLQLKEYSFSLNGKLIMKYGEREGSVLTSLKLIEGVREV